MMQVQNGPIASSGQIAVNANIPQRISPIDEAMSSLRSTQNATFQLLEELASRLEPVLQAEPPCSKKDANGEPSASQLHGEILQRSSAATDIHARIRGLIERLTV